MTEGRDVVPHGPALRGALDMVVGDYLRFLRAGPDPSIEDGSKAFASYQAGCKAALSHLELLIKVGRSLGAPAIEAEEAATILVEARAALAQTPEDPVDAGEGEC
ncbi:hypothetical protein [Neoroseomonas rubea]|uniref:hypothetical protein n=1 Tax=Neoroseomonas rubea TaxID=2748666 RepID=UPI0018E01823|nr:hypothetical protein [Roseomonas rubea]